MDKKILLGGLDIGTTGCKLSCYDTEGNYLTNAYRTYEVRRSCGASEIDAESIYQAVCEVIREIAATCSLAAVGITSFGETFAALDENDRVLFPSMLYTDPRGTDECAGLCRALGEDRITSAVGVKPHSMYSLPKVMWLKKNRPQEFANVRRILLMEDYVVYKLTGNAQIDYSLAARTMAFDIRKKCWDHEIFSAAGIPESLFSKPVPTGTVAGTLKPELARELGVSVPFTVVSGSHDQVASAVGAGVLEPGQAADGTGTVECIVPVFDGIPEGKRIYEEGYSVVPYVRDGTYVCYALSFTGGAVLKWFRDEFAKELKAEPDAYARLDAAVPEQPTGIFVLPHFSGAANPYMDNDARSAVVGLSLEHTRNDFYKALMEGVTYEMMTNILHLQEDGVCMERLFATGGGASSRTWLQIKADILNRPITALAAKEVGACGTCMLCGVALGYFRDLAEAKAVFVKERKTYLPDPERAALYADLYRTYRKLYPSVKQILKGD